MVKLLPVPAWPSIERKPFVAGAMPERMHLLAGHGAVFPRENGRPLLFVDSVAGVRI